MVQDEQRIIQDIQAGQTNQFGVLYDVYIESMYRFLYYKTHQKEVAEDLTSVVFLKAFEHIKKYSPRKGTFRTWLYQIARHVVIDHYRTQKPTKNIEDAWDLESGKDISRDVEIRLQFETLHQYLKTFSSLQRDIILMRLWEGLSFVEIADIVGKSEASCKMQFKRGVEKLQQLMPLVLFWSLIYKFL